MATRMRLALAALPCAMLLGAPARGADGPAYPNRPLRIVVPYSPGGGTDIIARVIGSGLSERLNQSVVIDNRAGANGIVGADLVAAASPDGYTLLTCTTAVATNASLYKNRIKYDPIKSFAPISLAVQATMLLVVHPSSPARTVKDLIALARSKPKAFSYSSYGNGSSPHLAAEMLKRMAGFDMLHVPFKGGAPAIAEVIAGRVTMTFATVSSVQAHLDAGRVKALGVATAQRSARYKDLPTIAESGVPGFDAAGGWTGICAPAGTPKDVVAKLHSNISDVMAQPSVVSKFVGLGYEVFKPISPEQFADMLRVETSKWAKVVSELDVRAE